MSRPVSTSQHRMRLVGTGGNQSRSIRAERQAEDSTRMAVQRDAHLTRRRVPDPDDPIGSGGREPGAIGAEREGMDRTRVASQSRESRRRWTGSRNGSSVRRSRPPGICPPVPGSPAGGRATAGGQHVAVGAERDTGQPFARVREHQRLPARGQVPDPDVSIGPGRRQASAVRDCRPGRSSLPSHREALASAGRWRRPRRRRCDSFPPPPARCPTAETPRLRPSVRPSSPARRCTARRTVAADSRPSWNRRTPGSDVRSQSLMVAS